MQTLDLEQPAPPQDDMTALLQNLVDTSQACADAGIRLGTLLSNDPRLAMTAEGQEEIRAYGRRVTAQGEAMGAYAKATGRLLGWQIAVNAEQRARLN